MVCRLSEPLISALKKECILIVPSTSENALSNASHDAHDCMYHLIVTLKKEAISKQFYTFEYVKWPHEAKPYRYVNSILMEVF